MVKKTKAKKPLGRFTEAMTPDEVWLHYQAWKKLRKGEAGPLTDHDLSLIRLAMKVREHRNAILQANDSLHVMGQLWVDKVVAYRVGCLNRLGVKS